MATEEALQCITLPAAGDLSASQYCFVRINSSGNAALPTDTFQHVIGILQNKPDAAGKAATIAFSGRSKVLCGGTVNPGDEVAFQAGTGKGVAVTTDTNVVGEMIEAGTSGTIGSVLLKQR